MQSLRREGRQGGELEAVKQRLSRVRGIAGRIAADLDEAGQLEALGQRLETLDARRFAPSNRRLEELKGALEMEVLALTQAKEEVREAIALVESPEEQTLLQLRYLCGKKWEEVADQMGYSWQGIHKVHRRVLGRLKEWMEVDAGQGV